MGTRYAIVTLDGTVLLVDRGSRDPMDSIMWNLQVNFVKNKGDLELTESRLTTS